MQQSHFKRFRSFLPAKFKQEKGFLNHIHLARIEETVNGVECRIANTYISAEQVYISDV